MDAPLGKLICFETPVRSKTPPPLSLAVYNWLKKSPPTPFLSNVELITLPMDGVPSAKEILETKTLDNETIEAMGEHYDMRIDDLHSVNREESAKLILQKIRSGTSVVLVGGYYICGIIETLVTLENDTQPPSNHERDTIRREVGLLRPNVTFLIDAINLPILESDKGTINHTRKQKYLNLLKNGTLSDDVIPLDAFEPIDSLLMRCLDAISTRCNTEEYVENYITGKILRCIFQVPTATQADKSESEWSKGLSKRQRNWLQTGRVTARMRMMTDFYELPTHKRLKAHLKKMKRIKTSVSETVKDFCLKLETLTVDYRPLEFTVKTLKHANTLFGCTLNDLEKRVDFGEEVIRQIHDEFM